VTWNDEFAPTHPLLDLSHQLEEATDAYVRALDEEAEAENEYLRKHATAYALAAHEGVASTVRSKHADASPSVVEAKTVWNLAVARAKATRAKCQSIEARLNGAQSYFRLVERQT